MKARLSCATDRDTWSVTCKEAGVNHPYPQRVGSLSAVFTLGLAVWEPVFFLCHVFCGRQMQPRAQGAAVSLVWVWTALLTQIVPLNQSMYT